MVVSFRFVMFVYLAQDTEIMVKYRVVTLLFINFLLSHWRRISLKTKHTRDAADRSQVNLWLIHYKSLSSCNTHKQ